MSNVKFDFPSVRFKKTNGPIDYFKLTEDYFIKDGFHFSKEEIKFKKDQRYLDGNEHLETLDLEKKETVVLNFQVGKGKSTVLHLLLGHYYNEGYQILICSPYIKLIENEIYNLIRLFPRTTEKSKIHEIFGWEVDEFRKGRDNVFFTYDYSRIDPHTEELEAILAVFKYPIHLLTINNLLGNPGDDRIFQSGFKQQYLDKLLTEWKDEKVVFFFDELHENTDSFKSVYLPNLLRWNGIVSKIFISSATFTPSSVPIIKALAMMTNKNVNVYESERVKNQIQSALSLHIMPTPYTYKTNYFLNHLEGLVKAYQEKLMPINIITSSKILAEKVAERFFGDKVIKEREQVNEDASLDYINLCTSETELQFNDKQNNIGTTFKTGVNLTNPNSVLIVVFPTIFTDSNYSNYGIFSDGVHSIIQTIGRMRNGGDMHLIVSSPKSLIEHEYPDIIKGQLEEYPYLNLNSSYQIVLDAYKSKLSKIDKGVVFLESKLHKITLSDLSNKNSFGFWYPNFHEFLIEYSQSILLNHNNPSFGREISPYVLWACLNNQFANANLKSIYHIGSKQGVALTIKNSKEVFKTIYKSKEKDLTNQSFRESVNNLSSILETSGEGNNNIPIKYTFSGKQFTSSLLINRYPSLVKAAIAELFQFKFGFKFPDNQYDYIRLCFNDISLKYQGQSKDAFQEQYFILNSLTDEFYQWITPHLVKDNRNFHYKLNLFESLDIEFAEKVKGCLITIQSNDFVFSSKAISFLQGLNNLKALELKNRIFTFLLNLLFEPLHFRKLINGEKYKTVKMAKSINSDGICVL